MSAWVLLVVAIHTSQATNRTDTNFPAVTMQEFSSEKLCRFAQKELRRKAGDTQHRLRMVCVPK